jgi:hypothetical protein
MNPVLKKLLFKGQSPVLVLGAPAEFTKVSKEFGVPVHTAAKGRYPFALAFARTMAEANAIGKSIAKALDSGALFWMAYPKGTSKKYPKADVNRDTGHAALAKFGLDGVSLVALDDDWSAMRFKLK